MNRLTKSILISSASLALCSAPSFAQDAGIYGTAFVLTLATGANSPANTLYQCNLSGGLDYAPEEPGSTNGAATLTINNYDYSGDTANGGLNLGTFNSATDTLVLDGGDVLTYKSGENVSSAAMYYSLTNSNFQSLNLSFNQDSLGSSGYDEDNQRWYQDNYGINLLQSNGSPVPNGTYTLDVYFQSANDGGTATDNNSGNNYTATFTIVPEPATWGMMLCSGLFGSFYLIRRRRK